MTSDGSGMNASTEKDLGLRFGPLGDSAVHLCVDMQNMFAGPTPWHTPWLERVLPNIERIVQAQAARTIFTRFIPARNAAEAQGTWRRYYRHWHAMTLDELDPAMVDLVPPLGRYLPLAELLDKTTYAPWFEGDLDGRLKRRGADTLVITGGETDVCVLGAVMGAVDRGYRVVTVVDALCSASDETHDAMVLLYGSRYGHQVELATTGQVLDAWA